MIRFKHIFPLHLSDMSHIRQLLKSVSSFDMSGQQLTYLQILSAMHFNSRTGFWEVFKTVQTQ